MDKKLYLCNQNGIRFFRVCEDMKESIDLKMRLFCQTSFNKVVLEPFLACCESP